MGKPPPHGRGLPVRVYLARSDTIPAIVSAAVTAASSEAGVSSQSPSSTASTASKYARISGEPSS
nr:MAG TPA: hypothetical protein [Caudoviricetes sp.]